MNFYRDQAEETTGRWGTAMKCYQKLLRISWRDIIENNDISKKIAKVETILGSIKERELRLIGDIWRMNDKRLHDRTTKYSQK